MKAKPKFVAPKSLDKADAMLEAIKARQEAFTVKSAYDTKLFIDDEPAIKKVIAKVDELYGAKPERYPVYLTMEEVSHIILAVEYADVDKYCDDTILTDINARLGACLANHYLAAK